MSQRFLIVGAGYTGKRLARELDRAGADVLAITRSDDTAIALEQSGFDTLALNLDNGTDPDVVRRISEFGADCIVYLVPPARSDAGDPRLDRFLNLIAPTRRFVYISTSGVYGDCDGCWVSEDVAPKPESARARRRFNAEICLNGWSADHQVDLVVLRVPAIYGPARLPLDRLERGQPALQPEDAPFGNRIHVDDLVSVIRIAAMEGEPGKVYNVSDTAPMKTTEYLDLVAKIAGLEPPRRIGFDEAQEFFSETQWSFMRESKKLDTQRMQKELGFMPRFANPADGIRASLDDS